MQDDPWAKRASGEDWKLHQHLAEIRPVPAGGTRALEAV